MKTLIFLLFLFVSCASPKTVEPKFPDGWSLVDCSECIGVGTVTYDANHWIVVQGFSDAGTYQCPICNGDKKLYEKRIR